MTWQKWENSANKGPESLTIKLAVFLFICFTVGGCVLFIANPFKQAARIVNKTIDADNVIYNYEWFKQRYQDVGAIDQKISQARLEVDQLKEDLGDRSGWDRSDKEEYARLNSVKIGLEQQWADIVAEYNARSEMVNRSIFKDNVPERIE